MSEEKNTAGEAEMRTPTSFIEIHHSHLGPILGVLVILLVLILSGLYLWGGMLSREMAEVPEMPIVNNEPETTRADADTQILQTVSSSDDLDAIDADLSATALESIDTDMTAIDAELNTALPQ